MAAMAATMKDVFPLIKRPIKAVTAVVILFFVLFLESAPPAPGQEADIDRAPQRQRVGRVRLPTPPFNPDAGVLDGRGRGAHGSHGTGARRPPARRVKAANRNPRPGTPRRRRVRRGRKPRAGVLKFY